MSRPPPATSPDPSGRFSEAAIVALATTTALAASLVLQVPSFAAPNVAYVALQHTTVCTWRNLVRRIAIAVAAGLVLVPVGGFLVQTPWLLVPAFFLMVALLTYGLPSTRNPVESVLIAFTLATVCFGGIFDPLSIPTQARNLVAASILGVVAATVFARFAPGLGPRTRLAESLGASFDRVRARLAESVLRALAEEAPGLPSEAPAYSTLGAHVQLLELVRQEGITPSEDRALVALTTAAERIESYVGTIDTLSRQGGSRTYRRLLATEIGALAEALDAALAAFAGAARDAAQPHGELDRPPDAAWPDLHALVRALLDRQLELRRQGVSATIGVAESASTNAFVQSLSSFADVLHIAPWQLGGMAAGERHEAPPIWPWSLFPLDRFALRYALQVALGTTIAFVVGLASQLPILMTLLYNPLLVAQTSYGATLRKAGLRLLGVLVGGTLAVLSIIAVLANTSDLATWLAVFFAVVFACQYALLGMPVNWYGAMQVAVTYMIVMVAGQPVVEVHEALWRVFGTFAGTAILFAVFRVVAPDYAGRQLIARFADLLRATLVYLPRPGEKLPPMPELLAARFAAGRCSADILRLVGESRLEGHGSGVDADAAVEAAGIALRISLRTGLVSRGRSTVDWPPLGPESERVLERLRLAVRSRVEADLALLEARHTMAAPGTRAHERACAAAARATSRPRENVAGPVDDANRHFGAVRMTELLDWPPDAGGALFAELEHYRRVAELLPRLDAALERMLLPTRHLATADHRLETGVAMVAGVSRR